MSTTKANNATLEKALAVYLALDKEVNKLHRKLNKLRIAEIESPEEVDRSIAGALWSLTSAQHTAACAAAAKAHTHYMGILQAEQDRAKYYAY